MEALTALLLAAATNAGTAVFLQRAEVAAPAQDIPMPHIWYEVTDDPPATQYRLPGGTVAVGGSTGYGRSLYRALATVTAVGDTFTQAHAVINQLRPKLDGWRGVAAAVQVDGIFIVGGRPDYSASDDVGSEAIDLEVWYRR